MDFDKVELEVWLEQCWTDFRLYDSEIAKETLTDPAKRFAYDRLGPDIIEWKHAKTIMDYVVIGGRRLIPFYVGSVVAMLGAQWFGFFENTSSYVSASQTPSLAFKADDHEDSFLIKSLSSIRRHSWLDIR